MAKIKTLKSWNEDHTKRVPIAPRTHVKAVFDDNGSTLDSLLGVQDEKLSELGSEVNGVLLGEGQNDYRLVKGNEYRFENIGTEAFNIGYVESSGTYVKIGYIEVGKSLNFISDIDSSIIHISIISGVKCIAFDLSKSIGGNFATFKEQTVNIIESINAKVDENNKDIDNINSEINGTSLNGGDNQFTMIAGETYLYVNNGSRVNVGYKVDSSQASSTRFISGFASGSKTIYTATENSTIVNVSVVSGVSVMVYKLSDIGSRIINIEEGLTKLIEDVKDIESESIGVLLTDGSNFYETKKGKTYFFRNDGNNIPKISIYEVDGEETKLLVDLGHIAIGGIKEYVATQDAQIIYISKLGGTTIRLYAEGVGKEVLNINKYINNNPVILKACSFNLGDFTGDGFGTPSEEGKFTYHKLLGKIGANLIGTQEDVDYYGTTTSGGVGNEDVNKSIYPIFKYYTRIGTGFYNYKGFASDYKIINIDKVYYTGDYYFTHPWFLRGDLEVNGKSILVLSFHWEWRDNDTRMAQIAQVIEYAQNYDYVIALGDTNSLNAKDGEYIQEGLYRYGIEWQLFKDAGYDMANNGNFGLFTTSHGGSPIDNIFVKGGNIKNAYIIQEEWMRDHYPIVADVVL